MDVRSLKERAAHLSSQGRFERAEVLYRQLLTHQPRDANLWLRHAEVLRRLDRVDASISSFRMAAQLLESAGHTARAVACLKIALELQPDDVDLVTDIIRFELRQQHTARERPTYPAPLPPPPDAGPADVPEAVPLLALPMFASTDSHIAELVPDANEPVPPPRSSAPRIPLEVESSLQRWPQVRRVSDHEIAIKPSPFAKWVVVSAASGVEVRFFDEYAVADEALWLEEPTD